MNSDAALDTRIRELEEKARRCMRCGVCQAVCPMFSDSGLESVVARGRLSLIGEFADFASRDPEELLARLDQCVHCASCQSACPGDIDIMEIFREARQILRTMLGRRLRTQSLEEYMPEEVRGRTLFSAGHSGFPAMPGGMTVALYAGCLADRLYHSTISFCLELLRRRGIGVRVLGAESCCGRPALERGDMEAFSAAMAASISTLISAKADYIVTLCASCAATMAKIWPVQAPRLDAALAPQAQMLGARSMEITAFLVNVLGVQPVEPDFDATQVCLHDACAQRKQLEQMWEPRAVLMSQPHHSFVEMPYSDLCCGSGACFALAYPQDAARLGAHKREFALASGAEELATTCSWCRWQLGHALEGTGLPVKHVVDIYMGNNFVPGPEDKVV